MKPIFCFTHHDLDGLVSALVVKWAHPDHEFAYKTTTPTNFREDYNKWLNHNKPEDYDTIFIMDLDIHEDCELVDAEYITIIDHHLTHVEGGEYYNADLVIEEYSSAAKLAYRTFKERYKVNFTPHQLLLVAIADDYDSYALNIDGSKILNAIFWQTQKRFEVFMKQFENGYHGITDQQKTMYSIYKKELEDVLSNLSYFIAKDYKYDGEKYYVIATFATKHINDVADHLIENGSPDIAIVVNKQSNHVSWRRGNDSKVELNKLAEKLTDGGGHAYAAGGKITEEFLAFAKKLKPRKKIPKINA